MSAANRRDVRRAFAALLTTSITSVQAVYAYQPGDLNGQSPVLTLGSAGSARERITMRGSVATFDLALDIFVVCGEDGSDTYTQAEAEDALDDTEQLVGSLIYDGQARGSNWLCLGYAAPSKTDFVSLDGREYKRERLMLAFQST